MSEPRASGPAPRAELRRLLVADRGMAALRALRWARQAKVEVVGLVAESDGDAVWPDDLDFAVYVPAEEGSPWPSAERALAAAHDAGCDAIHPGYTWLGRTPALVELMATSGLAWAGTGQHALGICADRAICRATAEELGLPVVPGSMPILDEAQGQLWLARVGLPVALRAVSPGRRGPPRRIHRAPEAAEALRAALSEGPVLLERLVVGAREVEVPVIWDGAAAPVALGDRDLTMRGAHGRLIVEAPAPALSEKTREIIVGQAIAIVRHLQLRGLCAVRFLVPPDGRPYLLQVIPGLSPWHGVTEALFGVDLFDAQLRIAVGDALELSAADLEPAGHHLWLDLRAAADGELFELPDMELRRDLAVVEGDLVMAGDSLGAMIVGAPTRHAAIVRARASLDGPLLPGVDVDRTELDAVFNSVEFWSGPLDRDRAAALLAGAPTPSGALTAPPPGP